MPDQFWPEETQTDPEWDSWDPVMLTEYLSGLHLPDPAIELMLEIRRHVLDGDSLSVDIRCPEVPGPL